MNKTHEKVSTTQEKPSLIGGVSCCHCFSGCVFAFMYCPSLASSWLTVSLHFTKEGAIKAMNKHKKKKKKEGELDHGVCWDVEMIEVIR